MLKRRGAIPASFFGNDLFRLKLPSSKNGNGGAGTPRAAVPWEKEKAISKRTGYLPALLLSVTLKCWVLTFSSPIQTSAR